MEHISTTTLIITLIVMVIISAYFSGSETGMMTLNRYRLRHMAKQGNRPAKRVEKLLQSFRKSITALVPYTEGSLIGWIHGRCEIIREEHTGEGVLLEVYVDEESANRLEKFKVNE